MSNFKNKTNNIIEYFNAQCNQITNNTSLPSSLMFKISLRLSSISFTVQDILKIINLLNISKARGYDNISMRILEIFDS